MLGCFAKLVRQLRKVEDSLDAPRRRLSAEEPNELSVNLLGGVHEIGPAHSPF